MTKITSALFLSLMTCVATTGIAWAQTPSTRGSAALQRVAEESSDTAALRTTCWYNEQGVLTGSEPAAEGVTPGSKSQVAASGAHSWKYTVAGGSHVSCPAKLPVSTVSSQS